MNQQCKVCAEPAAGFHFGAFTCEGCKSFFGRSYNNLTSISECKNQGTCVINKKNRTSCKACRLRKCLLVGMSKSGSRYGRRSNWFKIHCLLQEQQQQQQQQQQHQQQHQPQQHHHQGPGQQPSPGSGQKSPSQLGLPHALHQHLLSQQHALARASTKEDFMMLGLDEYKHSSTSPSGSSPESHNSDTSVDVGDGRAGRPGGPGGGPGGLGAPAFPARPFPHTPFVPLPFSPLASLGGVIPHPAFLQTPGSFMFPPSYLYKVSSRPFNNNNNETPADVYSKRFYLDALLQSQASPRLHYRDEDDESIDEASRRVAISPVKPPATPQVADDHPMDLSVKGSSISHVMDRGGGSSDREGSICGRDDASSDHERDAAGSEHLHEDRRSVQSDEDDDEDIDVEVTRQPERPPLRVIPLDLSART